MPPATPRGATSPVVPERGPKAPEIEGRLAERRPWPAVIKERKAATNGQRGCHASAPKNGSEYGCQIAYANACTGLVGLICSGRGHHEAKERMRVEEYLFLPPPRL